MGWQLCPVATGLLITINLRYMEALYWGHDPENYNVPDCQFAADQENPVAPILELKKMIQTYHE